MTGATSPKMFRVETGHPRLAGCILWFFAFSRHVGPVQATDWQPVAGKMMTRWGRQVTPANAWREHPRPQFERVGWQNLNGLWDYAITAKDATRPDEWQGEILVPFAVESTLSGVGHLLSPDEALWYRRTLKLNPKSGRRVLLNFEAVAEEITPAIRDLGIVPGFNDTK